MTLKDAMTLEPGDRVWLTRDENTWHVVKVQPAQQLIEIKTGLILHELRGSAAMRSIRRASPKGGA